MNDQDHQSPTESTHKPLNLSPKGLAQMTMLQNGVDAKTALLLTNPYKDTISREAVHKLRQKYKKYSLQTPEIVKLAHGVVRKTLKGEIIEFPAQKVTKEGFVVDYTETIAPSITNQLAAASMVYDRFEPVKAQGSDGPSGNTYIDLSSYQVSVNVEGRLDNRQAIDIDHSISSSTEQTLKASTNDIK